MKKKEKPQFWHLEESGLGNPSLVYVCVYIYLHVYIYTGEVLGS